MCSAISKAVLTYYRKKAGEKQPCFLLNIIEYMQKSSRKNASRLNAVLWVLAAGLLAAALGWYILDDRPRTMAAGPVDTAALAAGTAALDLNTATEAELDDLPGLGPALTGRIVAWREEHGPFPAPEDVTQVEGIGPALYEQIEPYIE